MKKKTYISLLLALSLVATSLFPSVSHGAGFIDMPTGWSREAMEFAVANGLLKGNNNRVRPEASLKRSEIATIIDRLLNLGEPASLESYKDVAKGDWHYDYMARMVGAGLLKGDQGYLRPDDSISREETFTIMNRVFRLKTKDYVIGGFRDGHTISSWAEESINSLAAAGYVKGDQLDRVSPHKDISREEFAQLLMNMSPFFISDAGNHGFEADHDGNHILNSSQASGDVTIRDHTINGDLIVAEGFSPYKLSLVNTKIEGRLVVRSRDTSLVLENSQVEELLVLEDLGSIDLELDKTSSLEKAETLSRLDARGEGSLVEIDFRPAAKGSKVATPDTKVNILGDFSIKDREGQDISKSMVINQTPPMPEGLVYKKLVYAKEDAGASKIDLLEEGSLDRPVWVGLEREGKPLGEGAMTNKESGYASPTIHIGGAGDYTILVKDKEDGELLAKIDLVVVGNLKTEIVTNASNLVQNLDILQSGSLSQPVWIGIEKDGVLVKDTGMTRKEPGYNILRVEMKDAGDYQIVLRDRKDGQELGRINFIVKSGFKELITIKPSRDIQYINLLELGSPDSFLWVELLEGGESITSGKTSSDPGYGFFPVKLEKPGEYSLVVRDRETGPELARIRLVVEELDSLEEFDLIMRDLDSIEMEGFKDEELKATVARALELVSSDSLATDKKEELKIRLGSFSYNYYNYELEGKSLKGNLEAKLKHYLEVEEFEESINTNKLEIRLRLEEIVKEDLVENLGIVYPKDLPEIEIELDQNLSYLEIGIRFYGDKNTIYSKIDLDIKSEDGLVEEYIKKLKEMNEKTKLDEKTMEEAKELIVESRELINRLTKESESLKAEVGKLSVKYYETKINKTSLKDQLSNSLGLLAQETGIKDEDMIGFIRKDLEDKLDLDSSYKYYKDIKIEKDKDNNNSYTVSFEGNNKLTIPVAGESQNKPGDESVLKHILASLRLKDKDARSQWLKTALELHGKEGLDSLSKSVLETSMDIVFKDHYKKDLASGVNKEIGRLEPKLAWLTNSLKNGKDLEEASKKIIEKAIEGSLGEGWKTSYFKGLKIETSASKTLVFKTKLKYSIKINPLESIKHTIELSK